MPFYVYILKSQLVETYYKGSSVQPAEMLIEHNNGESRYTKDKTPWDLVYVEECPFKRDMLIREKKLKRGNHDYYKRLIQSPKNIAHQFISNKV